MGLKFFQTRSSAIILYDTLPPRCIERVVSRKSQEVLSTKILKSPRLAPTIILKANWQKDWNSDAAAGSNSSQPTQPNQLANTEQPVVFRSRAAPDRQNKEEVKTENEEVDQANRVQPVVHRSGILKFRIQEVRHSKVKEAEQGRVRDLINHIESHPYQDDLQADLRRNNIFNPFTKIRRRWSTILETWKILNYAKRVPGCNAPMSLMLGKRYCMQYLWNSPQSYGRHASTESNKIWCIVDFELCDERVRYGHWTIVLISCDRPASMCARRSWDCGGAPGV